MSRHRVDQRINDIFIQSPTGTPLFRHQSSMEGVIDFATHKLLEPDERSSATDIFNQIVAQYEPSQTIRQGYKRVTLFRVTYEYVISKDNFLSFFFLFLERELLQSEDVPELSLSQVLPRYTNLDAWSREQIQQFETCLATFSDYLVDNFFLPIKASARQTPQPSPAPLSGIQSSEGVASKSRISTLRRDCLIRDHHRCVISHKFDHRQAKDRAQKYGDNAKDDDGQLLRYDVEETDRLEVAHILPHSLTSATSYGGDLQLSDSKKIALQILNMFDHGVIHLINGNDIDRPMNALTLTSRFHELFGDFDIYFEPVAGQAQPRYKIDNVRPNNYGARILPVTRTLYLTPDYTIEPPSPRLLAIHRAIGRILSLSGAGGYIDRIIRDMDEVDITENGSTELGLYISLKLGGWMDAVPVC